MALKRGYVVSGSGFEWHLRASGRSPATVRAYLAVLQRYAAVAHDGGDDPVRRYLRARQAKLAPASYNLEVSALRAWFRWVEQMDPGAWRPSSWPRMRRAPKRVNFTLSDADVGMLLAAPDLGTFVGFRDHVIMATLYQCGLRASELVQMQLGDVHMDGVLYVHGKGGHDRVVPYGAAWRVLLEEYLLRRAGTRPGKRAAVFVTRHGRPLRDARSVWVIVNRYARRALGTACGYARLDASLRGTPWRGHYPHQLRAAFATELLSRGMDVMAIAQLLGHRDVATTARYAAVDMTAARAAIACHPRAKRKPG